MIKVVKGFSYYQNFVPWGISALALGYIFMFKIVLILNVCSETAWAIFTRFHMGPSVEKVLTICSNGSVQLNKMATMPIYGKST